jgi:hypothetical protein
VVVDVAAAELLAVPAVLAAQLPRLARPRAVRPVDGALADAATTMRLLLLLLPFLLSPAKRLLPAVDVVQAVVEVGRLARPLAAVRLVDVVAAVLLQLLRVLPFS